VILKPTNRLISHTSFSIFAAFSTSASLHEAILPKQCVIKGNGIPADAITEYGQVEVKATFAQSALDRKFNLIRRPLYPRVTINEEGALFGPRTSLDTLERRRIP